MTEKRNKKRRKKLNEKERYKLIEEYKDDRGKYNRLNYALKMMVTSERTLKQYTGLEQQIEQLIDELIARLFSEKLSLERRIDEKLLELDIIVKKWETSDAIPILDYILLTDPCYMLDNTTDKELDLWIYICDKILNEKKEEYNTYGVYLKNGKAECYLLFGDTKYGDGDYPYSIGSHVVEIRTDEDYSDVDEYIDKESVCVDAGLIGIASFNKAWKELHNIDLSSNCTKQITSDMVSMVEDIPQITLNHYKEGNIEFYIS